ncbi:MAG: hypothetical protein JWO03_155 [Bacteroidetes bacterium]|nr:hypothetical protein [Bacteroidota bacterium]
MYALTVSFDEILQAFIIQARINGYSSDSLKRPCTGELKGALLRYHILHKIPQCAT